MFACRILVFVLAGTAEISAWTIDLPEVRQYYFEKYGLGGKIDSKTDLKDNEVLYNNYYSNSEYHKHQDSHEYVPPVEYSRYGHEGKNDKVYAGDQEGQKYADKYEYQTYMEKKVHQLVHNGSRYIDGLNRAIERFTQQLQNCSTMTYTDLLATSRWESCKNATDKSEHVRRLAQMALYTTRQLQEKAGHHTEDNSYEETFLVLRLAWFLDQLTSLTGFEPETQDETSTLDPSTTTLPPVTGFLGLTVPDDVKLQLLGCLQDKSSNQTAVERCRYPLPLPANYAAFYNITDQPPPARSLKKRSVSENPAVKFIQYYAKYKAWTNANPEETATQDETKTHVKAVTHDETVTRDEYHGNHLRRRRQAKVPEDPMQDISADLKHRAETYLKPNKEQSDRIRQYIDSLRQNRKSPEPNQLQRTKRSINNHLSDDGLLPEDPQREITFHAKTQPSFDVLPDSGLAARLRNGLVEAFRNGDLEAVRRYGQNYSPNIRRQDTEPFWGNAADIY